MKRSGVRIPPAPPNKRNFSIPCKAVRFLSGITQTLTSNALNTSDQSTTSKGTKDSSPISETFEHLTSLGLYRKTIQFLIRHIALIVLVLFLLTGVWILDDYGVGFDTLKQRQLAERNIEYVLGSRDFVYPDWQNDRYYGVTFELPLLLVERALGLEDTRDIHLMRHMVTHLFFLIGGLFCYLLTYRLFGNRLLALFAMLLFLLHPRIYAHSFFNSKDVPFLSMFMICLYLAHRAFGKSNIWWFVILGVSVGVLINLRIMGITLFVLVAGMQVLDLFRASDGDERRRVISLMGMFILSGLVTLYAVSPYLWSNPLSSFVEWFTVFSQHPTPVIHMFRGDLILSTDVNPPEYVPVWMSITTPPAVLVLGVAGTCLVLLRGLFRPRDVLADTRLRFCLMLVGCFVLPVVAVIVLSSNVYNGWRQMYFLYAPFCLLAVFGLQQLISVCLLPRARLRMLMYGAYGIGATVAVVSMFSIHPHQHLYFNFMVDRTTPEQLRSQYDMDFLLITFREGYEQLLDRHPSTSLHVRLLHAPSVKLNWEILEEGDRRWMILNDEYYDFYVTSYRNWTTSESSMLYLTSPLVYSRVIYGSKAMSVATADLSMVDDAVAAPYREVYHATISKPPDARANWDVYADDAMLTYIKERCSPSDYNASFFLHLTPDDIDDLPDYRRRGGHATRNFDFEFGLYGVRFDGKCMAAVPLPDDALSGIRTGQFTTDGELWDVAINIRAGGESAYRAEYESVVRDDLATGSDFEVHLRDDRLIYVKDPCDGSDIEPQFFLHVVPSDVEVLPPARVEHGFDNLDFIFKTRGLILDGVCVASIGLPDYEMERVRTGQWDPEQQRNLWKEEFDVGAD